MKGTTEEGLVKASKRVCKAFKLLRGRDGLFWDESYNGAAFIAIEGASTLLSFFEAIPRKRKGEVNPLAVRARWSGWKGKVRREMEEFINLLSTEGWMLTLEQLPGRMVMGGAYKGALILDFDADGMVEGRSEAWTWSQPGADSDSVREPFIIPALFEGEEVKLELAELPGMDDMWNCTHALPAGPMGVWAVLRKVE